MRPKAHILANYARQNLDQNGLIGQWVVKGIAFYLEEVLKIQHFNIQVVVPEAGAKGRLIIHVFDSASNPVFFKPKDRYMKQLIGFINIYDAYDIEFASGV